MLSQPIMTTDNTEVAIKSSSEIVDELVQELKVQTQESVTDINDKANIKLTELINSSIRKSDLYENVYGPKINDDIIKEKGNGVVEADEGEIVKTIKTEKKEHKHKKKKEHKHRRSSSDESKKHSSKLSSRNYRKRRSSSPDSDDSSRKKKSEHSSRTRRSTSPSKSSRSRTRRSRSRTERSRSRTKRSRSRAKRSRSRTKRSRSRTKRSRSRTRRSRSQTKRSRSRTKRSRSRTKRSRSRSKRSRSRDKKTSSKQNENRRRDRSSSLESRDSRHKSRTSKDKRRHRSSSRGKEKKSKKRTDHSSSPEWEEKKNVSLENEKNYDNKDISKTTNSENDNREGKIEKIKTENSDIIKIKIEKTDTPHDCDEIKNTETILDTNAVVTEDKKPIVLNTDTIPLPESSFIPAVEVDENEGSKDSIKTETSCQEESPLEKQSDEKEEGSIFERDESQGKLFNKTKIVIKTPTSLVLPKGSSSSSGKSSSENKSSQKPKTSGPEWTLVEEKKPSSKDSKRRRRDSRSRSRDRDTSRYHSRYSQPYSRNRRRNRRSRSRSPTRNRAADRTRESREEEGKIDKAKLLEIAKKNALAMMAAGKLPAGVDTSSLKQQPLPRAKPAGKSVTELTNFCKQLVKDGDSLEVYNTPAMDDDSNSPVLFHPFKVSEPPKMIMPIMMPAIIKKPEDSAKLLQQFPVSSGTQHREEAPPLPEITAPPVS